MVSLLVDAQKLSSVLADFAKNMATDFPIQAILDHLVECIVEILPITGAGVTLISDSTAPHYIAASNEAALRFEQLQTELGEGPCMAAYETGQSVAIADLTCDTRFPLFSPAATVAGLGAVFTFPLRHGEGRLGALDLYRETAGPLQEADMGAAQTLADVTTAYLLNARARAEALATSESFRHSSLHDSLTGLPNRLLLRQRLEHAVQRAQRSHARAAILFADIDRFKVVNDTHGHQVGDDLLCAIANRLARLIRASDTLARVSGDEFVFLCEDLRDAKDADALACRVKDAFADPFTLGALDLVVSASVGVAYAGPGQDISNGLLAEADIAMYQAKRKNTRRGDGIDLRPLADVAAASSTQ